MSTSNYLKKLEELKARACGNSGENNSSNKGSGRSSQSVLDRIKARADGTGKGLDAYNVVNDNYINTFISDVNKYASADEKSSYSEWNRLNLGSRASTIQGWLQYNKSNLDEETYKGYSDYIDGFIKLNDVFSQFKDEDEYNSWFEQNKRNEEMLAFDLEAGKAEIDALQEKYDSYTIPENELNGIKATEKLINDLKAENQQLELYRAKGHRESVEKYKANEKKIAQYQAILDEAYARWYGGRDELASTISQKNQYYTLASRMQKAAELASVSDVNSKNYDPEFAKYAQLGAGIVNPTPEEAEQGVVIFGHKIGGKEVGNIVTYSRDNAIELGMGEANGGGSNVGGRYIYNFMEDDEVGLYNYYLAKYGKDKAQEYLDSIEDTLQYRHGKGTFDKIKDNDALKYIFGIAAGLDQFGSGMRSLFSNEDYIPTSATQYASGMVREDLKESGPKLPDWLGGASLGQVGYDAITTTSNMLPSMFTSAVVGTINPTLGTAVGSTLLGASAAGNAKAEMLNLGYSKEQATAYGIMVGVAEGSMEFFLGHIPGLSKGDGIFSTLASKAVSKVDNALARVAIAIGGSFDEALEEGLQTIIEPWLKEIATNVDWDDPTVDEVLYSSLLGALSSIGLQGGTGAINVGANVALKNQQIKEHGQDIINDGGVDTLKQLALDMAGVNQNKEGQKLATLAGKVEGKASAKNVGKLSAQMEGTIIKQNSTDIQNALVEKGLSKKEAKTASAYIMGSNELSEQQVADIEKDEHLQSVIDDVLADPKLNISTDSIKLFDARTGNKITKPTAQQEDSSTQSEEKLSPTKNLASKEIVTEGKFKASESGKTKIGDTEVSIKEIASIKNGEMTLRLEDGSTVKASDVEYGSNNEALLYENVVHMGFNAATANAFINGYDGNMPVAEYALDFSQAYRYGELGVPKSEMGFASKFTDLQKNLAYDLGKTDAKYKASEKEKIASTVAINTDKNASKGKKKGKLHNTLTPTNETQRASLKALGVLADALNIDIYTFESPLVNGKRVGENGSYDPRTRSLRIDLYAGAEGKGTMLYTAAHELTHDIREKLPTKFKTFADFLFEQYGEKGISVSELIERKRAFLEEKGRITPDMTEAQAYDLAYEEVVADACESFLADGEAVAKIAELKKKDKTLWQTIKDFITKLVARIKAAYDGLSPDSVEGRLVAEMLDSAEKLKAMWVDMVVEASEVSDIVEIDTNTKSVAPMFSERTWTESEYVTEREKTAKAISKALNVDIKTAYKYIDDINSVARLIADDRARLDYEPNLDEKATVLKPNSDYKYSVDMSTLCAKRLLFTGTFDAIQRALPNMVFDSEDIVALREMMQKRGYEVACGICYVESTRREIGRITQEFIDRYKLAQKTGKPISRINSSGKEVVLTSAGRTFSADKNYTPNLGELNTTDIDIVKRDHREVYDAYLAFMNARGQAKPKLLETRAEYKGEILKSFKAKSSVEARNRAGGLRLQSFSDFEVPHLIDMMQIVMDMSRVGLKSQAYTKVPAFAEVFGETGVKINLSLIAKGDGLDSNGNLIFDDVEGINHKEAFKLRDKYSKNVGTILVGKTDAHIIAAMADPRIDYIIPFHKSSWKESLYDALGLTGYADYTETQHEKPIDKSRKISDYDPSEYWDFTKSGDENAQIYLEKCREDGRIPKFPQFQGYPGYWKLLIDFKMYDNDGIGAPQEVVKPVFNTEASERILREYEGGHRSFPVAKDVVEDFVKEHKGKTKYSNRTFSYNELVAKGNLNGKVIQKNQQIRFSADGSIDVDWVVQQVKNKCKQIQTNAKQPTYYIDIPDIGENVEIINNGIKHGFIKFEPKNGKPVPQRSLINARVALELPWLLQNSIEVNRANKSNNANVPYSHILIGTIGLEAKDGSIEYYAVRSVVEERINQPPAFVEAEILGRLHASNAKKIGLPRVRNNKSLSQGVTYEYSIAHLVEDVKSEFNDTFSHDVYKKLGMQRKTNDFSKHLLYSDRASYAPTFYSYMGKVVDDIKSEKIGAGGVVSYLKGRGVKDEEIKWSGIEAFLEGKKSVTKAELQEFVAGSQLEIEGKEIGESGLDKKELWDDFRRRMDVVLPFLSPEEVDDMCFDDDGEFSADKFKEELQTLVDDDEINEYTYEEAVEYVEEMEEGLKAGGTRWGQYKLDGGTNYRELVFKMPDSSYTNMAMKAHWGDDAEGVLAHARIQDMTTTDGKKMLFVEEIQSDWHNEGQKRGYRKKYRRTASEITKESDKAYEKFYHFVEEALQEKGESAHPVMVANLFYGEESAYNFISDPQMKLTSEELSYIKAEIDKESARQTEMLDAPSVSMAEDAPFRDTYHEYVLKRLIRMAAEEGYDSIGWTPAEIQSKRWSDEFAEGYRIEYDQDIPKFLKKYGKKWGAKVGHSVIEDSINGRYLYTDKATGEVYTMEEAMTKAEQIVETKYNEPVGMGDIEFSITGAVYVETEKHNTYIAMEVSQSIGTKVWSMDITDSMRDSVLNEGQVLYSERSSDSVSNRSLLANALESVAQNDIERSKLAQYKEKIALIESEQAKLAETRAKIKELSFAKGRRDTEAIKKLQFEANQSANRINTYDRQLLNLESTKALKGVLEREKQMAYKKAEKKGKEALEKQRERNAKSQRELLTRYQESRKKGIEGRRKTEMRYKIKTVVNDLNQYLLKGTKEKHVPIELQGAVAEALASVNMDTVGAEERIAKKRAEMMVAKTPEAIEKLAKEIAHIEEMGGNMEAKLSRLKTAYDSIINSDDPLIANSHDDVISNSIDKVIEIVGNTPIRDMSLYQLEAVYDMYRMVLASVRKANKAFKAAKNEEISTIANGVIAELDEQKKSPKVVKGLDKFSQFNWNNLKPVYAFERIGSANFTKVFNAVRAGEDVWAKDMSEAQAFREEQYKKHGYDSFDFDKKYDFVSSTGREFTLNLGQIMSLYAYSKRGSQAKEHLKYGGFQFDGITEVKEKKGKVVNVTYQLKDTTVYKISDELLNEIIGVLDKVKGAKTFVDEMQEYLSSTMGEKGNEVSLEMYEVKLFKEKNYFPLKVSHDFLARAREQAQGDVKIKNSGFTKETTPNAKNPIVLSSFMDVWAGHVNEMSMYHAFTLPLEDFYRVFNYGTPTDEKLDTISVVSSLRGAHRDGVVNYIDQLLKDLNGGARSDPRETFGKAMMANFKKAKVMASLSVVVQQPTAMVRAMALVDSKYFVGKPDGKKHKQAWAEVKKYAPIAVIKEMGYFDTGMGKGSVEWLKGEKTWKDKVNDAVSKAPALADELTWVAIWNAVKRETLHTHKHLKPNSELFLKAVGERFTEVIVKTQVYDSTLARSANMRSKGAFMNMATSFLAEPTTAINMLQDALRKGKSRKYRARVIGAVYGSVILNSALVSLVYAMRDDDEDETFLEKYLSRFTTEVLDGINPLTYIPFVKDIWSIAQGFDVERADMSLVTDLFDSLQQTIKVIGKDTSDMDEDELAEHKKSIEESVGGIADTISSLFGIPVANVRRDINGIINGFNTIKKDITERDTTAGSLGDNLLEDVKDSVPVWGWLPDESKGEKLYDAIINGDTAYVDRLKGSYKSENAYNSAIRQALRENDSRIEEAATAVVNGDFEKYTEIFNTIVGEGNFSKKDVKSAIDSAVGDMTEKEESSDSGVGKEESIYEMDYIFTEILDGDVVMAHAMKEDIIRTAIANGKDRDEAETSFNNSFTSGVKKRYEEGDITDSKAKSVLMNFGGKTEIQATSKIQYWDYTQDNPDKSVSESWFVKYNEEIATSGIHVDVYIDYKLRSKGIEGEGKKERLMEVINSLPISSSQKDALYFAEDWASSRLYEAPWH